jgi:hypothetical protein
MRRLAVIVVALVVACSCTPSARHPAAGPASPVTVPAAATTAELSAGQWAELPAPPIEARLSAHVVWTGHLLLVWGGGTGKVYDDGADYDPETRHWRTLPPSPLGVRAGETAVWTGRVWVIWGGLANPTGTPNGPALANGAAYDPVARTWRRMAPAPLSARSNAAGVWTGREVVVLGGGNNPDAAAYDPATDRWRKMAPFRNTRGHDATGSYAVVWTGARLLAWRAWIHLDNPNSGRSSYESGSDLASYDPSTDRWRPIPVATGAPRGVSSPLWTGREVFVPSSPAPTPYLNDTSDGIDRLYDPAANRWTQVPSPSGSGAVWTGASVVEVVAPAPSAPGAPYAAPFTQLAAWEPGADHWTSLPLAPEAAMLPIPVWTGQDLLYWSAISTNITGLSGWSLGR